MALRPREPTEELLDGDCSQPTAPIATAVKHSRAGGGSSSLDRRGTGRIGEAMSAPEIMSRVSHQKSCRTRSWRHLARRRI